MGQHLARRNSNSDKLATNCWNIGPHTGRYSVLNRLLRNRHGNFEKPSPLNNFVDLNLLPPELGLQILQNLNATDLCLASCVWEDLANDESLWEGLCKASWGYCSSYHYWKKERRSFKKLFLTLDEGSLTFNTDPIRGIDYFVENEILVDNPEEIAKFFHCTNQLCWKQVRLFLRDRPDVLEEIIKMQSYKNQFLPNALRRFFHAVDAPTSRGDYLSLLLDKFSQRFCLDNPGLQFTTEIVTILCYSLILLSVDLTSPHVKNKMSKREFIRNICRAIEMAGNPINNNHHIDGEGAQNAEHHNMIDRDFAGHLYDNVYLVGHVAPQRWDDTDNGRLLRRH